jgi:polar amino acid transport system substrate-binding protein
VKYSMRTSLSCAMLAVFLSASAGLAACSSKATPAPAPTATRTPLPPSPVAPTRAPLPTAIPATPTSVQTFVAEKEVEVIVKSITVPAATTTTPTRPVPSTPVSSSPSDWDRIRAAGQIVVGLRPQYWPFSYYNENGVLDGFDIAVVREAARRLNLATVARDVAPGDLADAIRNRLVDLALPLPGGAAGIESVADFTKPFHICRDVILADEGSAIGKVHQPADLGDRTIGVLSGSRHEAWLQSTLGEPGQLPAANVLTYTLTSQLVAALRNGQLDLAIVDAVQATPVLKQGGVRLVGQDLDRQERRLAVPKGSDQLRSAFDSVLAEMARDGTLVRLSDQHLGLEPAELASLRAYEAENQATSTPSPTPTSTPPSGSFAAEPIHIAPGECTRFAWNVENVREIYFYVRGDRWEDSPTTGHESRVICLAETTTYELRIVYPDGATEVRPLTILVDAHAQLPLAIRLSTTPASVVQLGECVTVSWDVHGNPSSVQVTRDQTVLWDNAPPAGSLQDCPSESRVVVYRVLASRSGQTIQTRRLITVNP